MHSLKITAPPFSDCKTFFLITTELLAHHSTLPFPTARPFPNYQSSLHITACSLFRLRDLYQSFLARHCTSLHAPARSLHVTSRHATLLARHCTSLHAPARTRSMKLHACCCMPLHAMSTAITLRYFNNFMQY